MFNQDYMATDWNFFIPLSGKRYARKEIEVCEEDDQIVMGIPIYSGEKKCLYEFWAVNQKHNFFFYKVDFTKRSGYCFAGLLGDKTNKTHQQSTTMYYGFKDKRMKM